MFETIMLFSDLMTELVLEMNLSATQLGSSRPDILDLINY